MACSHAKSIIAAEPAALPFRGAEGVRGARSRPVGPRSWCARAVRKPPLRPFDCRVPRSLPFPVEPVRAPGVIRGRAVAVNRRVAALGPAPSSRLRGFCRVRSRRHSRRLRGERRIARLVEERVVGEHGCHDNAGNGTRVGEDRRQQVHGHPLLNLTLPRQRAIALYDPPPPRGRRRRAATRRTAVAGNGVSRRKAARALPTARPDGKNWNRRDLETVDPLWHRSVCSDLGRQAA